MNVTNTSSIQSCVFPLPYKVTVSTLLSITFLLSPILNLVVCYTIFSVKKLHTFGNILIANLSIGDIIISSSLSFMEILYVSIYPKWLTGKPGTYVLNAVWLFSLSSPFVTVTVMTCERYKTIKSLISVTSKSVTTIVIALIWLYNFCSVTFMVFFFTEPEADAYEWNILPIYYYPFLGIHIVIPLIVIAVLYVCIYFMTRDSGRGAAFSDSSSKQLAKREMRVAKTIGIVIGVMFAIWIPALVLEYFYAIGTESCIVQMAGPVSVWLSCSNGIVNPLLYFYRNPNLRGEIAKKLPRRMAIFLRLRKAEKNSVDRVRAATNQGFQHSCNDLPLKHTGTSEITLHIQHCKAYSNSISDTKL